MAAKKQEKQEQTKTIMFAADWCPSCKVMKKLITKTGNEAFAEAVDMVDVDTSEGAKLAESFRVNSIPTFVRPDGKKFAGPMNAAAFKKFLGIP